MFKGISEIKKIGYDKELNEITNKLPDNKKICEDILIKVNNNNVKIRQDESKIASLYLVFSNTILIANIKNSFTRVQTIAHECLHSIQDKKFLWFNFIFYNIYTIFFITICILGFVEKINNYWAVAVILLIFGLIFLGVRTYLEMDAMIKARYLAKEYLLDNSDKLSKEEIDLIISKYDYINDVGIKLTVAILAWKPIFRFLLFIFICIIK